MRQQTVGSKLLVQIMAPYLIGDKPYGTKAYGWLDSWERFKWNLNQNAYKDQGAISIRKTVLPGMAIPVLKIRRPNGRLIFNMEITIRR